MPIEKETTTTPTEEAAAQPTTVRPRKRKVSHWSLARVKVLSAVRSISIPPHLLQGHLKLAIITSLSPLPPVLAVGLPIPL